VADNTVNIVITAVDNASKVLTAIGNSFNLVSGGIKDVTSKYIEYGDQVKQLSSFTGMSNVETSKLIQLADDAFVSYDTLKGAARAMAMENQSNSKEAAKLTDQIEALQKKISSTKKPTADMTAQLADLRQQLKDVQPSANLSIESLASLSDQYMKLGSETAKTDFLLQNFKRSGVDLAKIMELGGDKILTMSKNVSDSLIIDDKKAASILKTKQRLDDFNDTMDGMKYDTAQTLLDIFDKMPEPLQKSTLWLNQFLSPTNINTLVQFGILLKGVNIAQTFAGIQNALLLADTAVKVWAIDAWAALPATVALIAPFVGLAAAIASLIYLLNSGAAKAAWQSLEKLVGIGLLKTGVINEQQFMTGAINEGLLTSSPTGLNTIIPGGGGGGTTVINYQPTVSTANKDEAIRFLASLQPSVNRQMGR
jgi:hypothetical protein